MPIDELDLLLIEELKMDARQPVRALARKLGFKRSTIRYRLDRLISDGVLKILCKSDLQHLGYKFSNLICIRTRPDRAMAVANHLASLSTVKHVCLSAGRFNVMAFAFYRDKSEIGHFISRDLADISGISSIEINHVIQRIKVFSKNKREKSHGDPPPQISDLDLSLISVLEQDPRQTITNIAQTIGCSQAVARNKLNKLLNAGTIWLFPIIDPTVVGAVKWVLILIKPELDKMNAVTDRLSSQDTIMDLSLIAGQWQLMAVTRLQEGVHTYDSILNELSTVPGIKEFEVLRILKAVKFSPSFI